MRTYLQDLGKETYGEMRKLADVNPQLKDMYGMPEEFPDVTDHEVVLMLKMADKSGEGTIRKEEVAGLKNAWETYLWNKPVYIDKLKQFERDEGGKLKPEELKKYLESLLPTKGETVSDEDVSFVQMKAENLATDNKLEVEEYVFATAAWEGLIMQKRREDEALAKKSKMCAVL